MQKEKTVQPESESESSKSNLDKKKEELARKEVEENPSLANTPQADKPAATPEPAPPPAQPPAE